MRKHMCMQKCAYVCTTSVRTHLHPNAHVCMRKTHAYAKMCVRMYMRACTCVSTYVLTYLTYVCMPVHGVDGVYVSLHAPTYIRTHALAYVHTCVCACVNAYVHMHVHTYTHTLVRTYIRTSVYARMYQQTYVRK